MPVFIIYLLKLSISLSVTWLFYQSMLRRLTFYNLNRWYLLGYSLLSFIIPLIDIGAFLPEDKWQGSLVLYLPLIAGDGKAAVRDPGLFARLGSWDFLLGTLLAGSVILLIRLLVRWRSLRRVRRQARLISDAGMKVFEVDQSILPFSFGNAIYINPRLHTEQEYSTIILHEYVHIRQRHTVDILLSEWLCIVNWFNPFVWLIRYSIRQNLEFIADRKVLEKGLDKKGYQYHLLQVVGISGYRLANNFNFSSLKKRIIMMNKIKSAQMHLLKFLFIVPLLAVLLLAFRGKINAVPAGRSATAVNLRPLDTLPVKTDSAKPLFIVDGVQMEKNWPVSTLSPDDIQSIEVLKDRQAVVLFGAKGRNGVVAITTKKSNLPAPAAGSTLKTFPLVIEPSGRLSDPLYYKDGVEVSPQELKALNPADIESINVLKGDSAAASKYGEKGRNGVILIKTKPKADHVKESQVPIIIDDKALIMDDKARIMDDKKDGRIVIRVDTPATVRP
ncbi:MAG TPA: M56 family metallopeptidase [Puia sp.]|nr:M56 family metallopeptidase [Puia sp.]